MVWEECVTSVRQFQGSSAKEVGEVDWRTISQDDLNAGFAADKPFPLVCPGRHCTEGVNQSPGAHKFCNCTDVNGNPIAGCTPKALLTPFLASMCLDIDHPTDPTNWSKSGRNCTNLGASYYSLFCWCCCSCFANGTLIAVPLGVKKIEDFQVGDKVMAASISGDPGSVGLVWEPARVGFSFGTGDGQQQDMVYLHYGESGSMICTPDQLFLLQTGKVKRGDRLVPGRDQLVGPNGDAVDLHEISLGAYQGGVHHIATKDAFNGDLQGHLLNSAGIVTGDFDLQIHADQLKAQFFVANHDQLPVVGSAAYEAAYPELAKTDMATYDSGRNTKPAKPLQFFAYKHKQYDIPADAAAYLTKAQATDVANAKLGVTFDQVSLHNLKVRNLLATFSGHYKAIEFVHLMGHMEVNAFAYAHHSKSFVALTQGLTRLEGLDVEGLALILAHLINRLSRNSPTGENGWMSVGMADYYSGGDIQSVYFGTQASAIFSTGQKQIENVLFAHMSAHDIYVDDPYQPTTATRSDALAAGYGMEFPPPGIGGPEQGGLQVVSATASAPHFDAASFITREISKDASHSVFQLLTNHGILDAQGVRKGAVTAKTDLTFLFSDVTDPEQRTYLIDTVRFILANGDYVVAVQFNMSIGNRPIHPEDFTFTPSAVVDGVRTQLPDAGDIVQVQARLDAGTYRVTVDKDVVSQNGSTLSPEHDAADITVS